MRGGGGDGFIGIGFIGLTALPVSGSSENILVETGWEKED